MFRVERQNDQTKAILIMLIPLLHQIHISTGGLRMKIPGAKTALVLLSKRYNCSFFFGLVRGDIKYYFADGGYIHISRKIMFLPSLN